MTIWGRTVPKLPLAYGLFSLSLACVFWNVSGSPGWLTYVTKDQAETAHQSHPMLKEVVWARISSDETMEVCLRLKPRLGLPEAPYLLEIPLNVYGAETDAYQIPSTRSKERDLDGFEKTGFRHIGRLGYQVNFPWDSLAAGCNSDTDSDSFRSVAVGGMAPFGESFRSSFRSSRAKKPLLKLANDQREAVFAEIDPRFLVRTAFVYATDDPSPTTGKFISNYYVIALDGERNYPNGSLLWLLPFTATIDILTAPMQLVGFFIMLFVQISR